MDIEEIAYLTKKDTEIVHNIQNEILNMPALNITYNEELLNQTIIHANNFSNNKCFSFKKILISIIIF